MSYRDTMRPPSFRGVPFEVNTSQGAGGRRVIPHEYPQRDQPYIEDMGRATRKFTLNGFVVEPNYFAKRDRLLTALERGGPGTLIHPFFGAMEVSVESFTVAEGQDGGMALFTMAFIESGAVQFPSQDADTTANVSSLAQSARAQVATDFAEKFSLTGQPDFVAEAAKVDLRRGFRELQRAAGG